MPLGLPFDHVLDGLDVAQEDEANAYLLLEYTGRASRACPFDTISVDGRCSANVIQSLLVAVLGTVQVGEVVEGQGDIRVLGTEGLLKDDQRPLAERFRGLVAALGAVQRGEVNEAHGDVGELLSKVVYGLIMRRRDPGVLHLRI